MSTAVLATAAQRIFDVLDEKAQRVTEEIGAFRNRVKEVLTGRDVLTATMNDFDQSLLTVFGHLSNGNGHLDQAASKRRSEAAKKAATVRRAKLNGYNQNGNDRAHLDWPAISKKGWKTRRENMAHGRISAQDAIASVLKHTKRAMNRDQILRDIPAITGQPSPKPSSFSCAILVLIGKRLVERHGLPCSTKMTYSWVG